MIEDFINDNYEIIYEKYSETYPEEINSDFLLEDVDNLEDFINKYMEEELKTWKKTYKFITN